MRLFDNCTINGTTGADVSVRSSHEDKTIGPVNIGNPHEFTVKDSQAAHRKNTVLHCLHRAVKIEFKPNESCTGYSCCSG